MRFMLLMLPSLAMAWTSALYPSTWKAPTESKSFYDSAFVQDYSYAGYHRGEVPLPAPAGPVLNVTKAPFFADATGGVDATVAIQAALDSVGKIGGGIVYLPTGTYRINADNASQALNIRYSNVVLRGAGADQTFLYNTTTNMRAKFIVKTTAGGSSWNTIPGASSRTAIVQDLPGPNLVIPVASTDLFKVGDWVLVRNRITLEWVQEHHEPGWEASYNKLTGFVYCRQVVSMNAQAKTLTVDVPIRYALFARDTAMVHLAPPMLSEVGVEDLAIGNAQIPISSGWGENDYSTAGTAAYDAHSSYVIDFNKVRNGWIRRVKSYLPSGNTSGAHVLSNGILVEQSRGVTLDSCDFSHGQYGGGGGNGYMYRISANEVLIKDSRATFARHGFVLSHMFASGNVFLRVHDKEGGKQTGLTGSMTTSGKGSDHHMHFSHSNLFDQCISENSNFQASYRPYGTDPLHNLTSAHSTYWNTTGLGSGVDAANNLIITQQSRYGYVIGTQGARTQVSNAASGDVLTKTAPLDLVEGVGQGNSLIPQSLYSDQLAKRLQSLNGTVGIKPIPMQKSVTIANPIYDLLGRMKH